MKRLVVFALIVLAILVQPVAAHSLRVFAAIEGNAVSGYAFFIGGGRAKDTPWNAVDEAGREIGAGRTGADGAFRFTIPEPIISDITVTVDTQEGHFAATVLKAARFGAGETAAPAAVPATSAAAVSSSEPPEAGSAALVEAAVQRQVAPLMQRIEEMDARLRFADILAGIFLIIGLAGIGLWARSLRK
ncbi:MAG: cobalamin biosynthesis protein CbiL [Alphaproteobacteria bacterium]|nr:cobalamin biosynthesis protein CbiL [Alphaproteobacteria bacterium]